MSDDPKTGNPLLDGAVEGEGQEAGVSATVDQVELDDGAQGAESPAQQPATADKAAGGTLPPLPTQGVAGGFPVAERDAQQVLREKATAQQRQEQERQG